eukprot:Selendium_serpulae@DN2046_c0_g1_i1.p1
MATRELAMDLVEDVTKLLTSSRVYIRKRALICSLCLVQRYPEGLSTARPRITARLQDEEQDVLAVAANVILELTRRDRRTFHSVVPALYQILLETHNNWTIIKILKTMSLLCEGEPVRLPGKIESSVEQLMTSTKAKSVEFEAMRVVFRWMRPESKAVRIAIERLKGFCESVDRNIRYLGVTVLQQVISDPKLRPIVLSTLPDVHQKALEFSDDSDPTLRAVAMSLLHSLTTAANFREVVDHLSGATRRRKLAPSIAAAAAAGSGHHAASDQALLTILDIGEANQFEHVSDFAWYLLQLADMAATRPTDCTVTARIAHQLVDIATRVPGARVYAVELSYLLLDRAGAQQPDAAGSGPGGGPGSGISRHVITSCAWILGEYAEEAHSSLFTSLDAANAILKQASSSPKDSAPERPQSVVEEPIVGVNLTSGSNSAPPPKTKGALGTFKLPAGLQQVSIWACVKLLLAAYRDENLKPDAKWKPLQQALMGKLPLLAQSPQVEVSERAMLAYYFVSHKPELGAANLEQLFAAPLRPVVADAQGKVPVPPGVNPHIPFFEAEGRWTTGGGTTTAPAGMSSRR